jgi:hypothetical protein
MSKWKTTLFRYYESALAAGLPIFIGGERRSTPFNSAPYVVAYARFLDQASGWPGRSDLLRELQACLEEARSMQLIIDALLLGGSFLDLANPHPKDIDCVWLYRSLAGSGGDVELLLSLQVRFKRRGVDMRFIPLDVDPLLFAKTLGFFSILYAKRKGENCLCRAPILVDCAREFDSHYYTGN